MLKKFPLPHALLTLIMTIATFGTAFGGALSLDGVGDIVTFPGTGIPSGGSPFTIEAWINPDGPTSGQAGGQITFWGNQSGNQANGFRLRGPSGTRFYFWGNDHDENFGTSIIPNTTGPNADGWHHLAITFNGTQTQWYWNGAPLGNPRTANPGVNVAPVNHRIGSRLNAEFFDGFIDELRIWSVARSAAEVASDMNQALSGTEPGLAAYWDFEGDMNDRAGGDNNGTPVGNATVDANVNAPIQTAGPRITSFTATPSAVYEAGTLTFAWQVDASQVSGTLTVELLDGASQVLHTTANANGSHPIVIGDTGGTAQTITYTLRASESGGSMVSREATVEVDLLPGIPVANPQPALQTVTTTPLPITLTGSDPNNHPNAQLTFSIATPPAGGTLAGTPPNVTYTANAGFLGFDSFTFRANDGKYDSAPGTVTINVIAVPTAPTDIILSATSIGETVALGGFVGAFTSEDVNLEDTHSYTLVAGAGDTDNALFTINGNQLLAQASFAGQVGNSFSLRVRSTDSGGLWFEKNFTLTVIAVSADLVINEIHYNPPDNTVRQEFIELYNPGTAVADLTGWRLSSAVSYVFPNGTTIPPDGYLLVAEDPPTMLATFGVTALGPYEGSLDAEGEIVRLRDASNRIVDEVDYKVGFPWPVDSNGDGSSMELINPALNNSHGSSWRASNVGGTVGPPPPPLVPAASSWRYFKGLSEASSPDTTAWRQISFDDATWLTGQSPFFYEDGSGYAGNTDLTDMRNRYSTLYLRNTFVVTNPAIYTSLILNLQSDDGCIVWLNGTEVARLGAAAGEIPFNGTASDSSGEPKTASVVVPNPTALLQVGANVLAVQALNASLGGSSDFLIEAELKAPDPGQAVGVPTPGARNSVFAENAPPSIRRVNHTPKQPASTNQVVITAKVTDPDLVASVTLEYQVVQPGAYIPAFLPHTVSGGRIRNFDQPRDENPAYNDPANWTTVTMTDDGLGGDEAAGDDIYTVVLPAQAHRTLVRYRITVADTLGNSARVPYPDDRRLNFAYFVYNGVPEYHGHSVATLTALPVYQVITRAQDWSECFAWNNSSLQIGQGGLDRFYYNWNGTLVYDGEVYDNIRYRLRGANGRYHQNGKRSMRFRLNDGNYFQARDRNGKKFPFKWRTLTTSKGFENRQTLTYALNEAINMYLWDKIGVPSQETFWVHWRVIDGADEAPDQWHGDFWGLNFIVETYDVRFLDRKGLPKGNMYKLINQTTDAAQQLRYQAAFAPSHGEDHDNIENNLTGNSTADYIRAHVNLPKYYLYHAFSEAIRNYDFWPSANKNMVYYFYPDYTPANDFLGQLWILPWDSDASWGPTWNNGFDVVYNSLFATVGGGSDSASTPELWPEYYNEVRQLRDLLWQEDQINPLIDAFAAGIADFIPADSDRWKGAPADAGNYGTLGGQGIISLEALVQDMKNFAFSGGSWPGGSVGAGGRAAHLDSLQGANGEGGQIPATPTATFVGTNGFPLDGLVFQSSAFADPQGAGTFGGMQWRVAEVLPPGTVVTNPTEMKLEWDAAWVSEEFNTFTPLITLPPSVLLPDRLYRVRVRHKDNTGRWSHWSLPFEFRPGAVDLVSVLRRYLVISEIMYNPTVAAGQDDDDYEWLELKNTGPVTLDLSSVYFSQGINFVFPIGTTLAPNQTFLLARNPLTFAQRYPGVSVDGDYGGKLDNGGETLELSHPHAGVILSVTYDDRPPWPVAPDGHGFSLVLVDAATATYQASAQMQGTPGSDGTPTSVGGVVINEILTGSTPPMVDTIELVNLSASPIDVAGWYLTDDPSIPKKYRLPPGNVIPAGGFLVVDENQFNPTPGSAISFSLSSFGEQIYLFSGDAAGELTGYSHGFAFGGAPDGVSFGRYLNSVGEELFPLQRTLSFAATNTGPRVGPVVISEINYHPFWPLDEFVELHNLTDTNVLLYDPAFATNGWAVNGLGFAFGPNRSLAAHGYLLLIHTNADPAAFRARHQVPFDVTILQYPGTLQDSGENLELLAPDVPTTNGTPYYAVDQVRYNDRPPWATAADGLGPSLQRVNPAGYGNDPSNWVAAVLTPGTAFPGGTPPVIIDPPANQTVAELSTVTFHVQVAGPGPFTYRWAFNGIPMAGATNDTLTIDSVQLTHAGGYSVIVSGAGIAVTSREATLNVLRAPRITGEPVGSTVSPGESWTFSVVATGTGTVTFQWRRNGADIPGANGASYTVNDAQLNVNDGAYTVVVSDSVGARESAPAELIVLVPPTITQQPSPTSVTVPEGGTLTLSVSAEGTLPITYRFRSPRDGFFRIMELYSAPAVLVVENVNAAEHQGIWSIAITNIAGRAPLSDRVTVTVEPAPPHFALSPTNETVVAGTDLVLHSEARGTAPITYQWYYNDTTALAGETSANLILSNVPPANAGDYYVVAANSLGRATSQVANVTILETPQIVAQPTAQATTVCSNAVFTVSAIGADTFQWYFNTTTLLPGATTDTLTLSQPSPSQAGNYSVVAANASGAVTSAVATLTLVLGDQDGDGMLDAWELAHGLNPCNPADRDLDPDHDGRSNWEESISGTDPHEAASVLRITLTNESGGGAHLQFQAASDVDYTIQYRDSVSDGPWLKLTDVPAQSAARNIDVSDPQAGENGGRFYRLVTPRQP